MPTGATCRGQIFRTRGAAAAAAHAARSAGVDARSGSIAQPSGAPPASRGGAVPGVDQGQRRWCGGGAEGDRTPDLV